MPPSGVPAPAPLHVPDGPRGLPPSSVGRFPSDEQAFGPGWLPRAIRRNLPAILLIALSITIPELLTGSTPVVTLFVNPVSLLFLAGLYGCGALVIREVAVRWRKGWPTVLLLGFAYGIVEEGFGTKTFFMSPSAAAGVLATFGHAYGVSWVWAADISAFHAVFSIGLPILLVGLIFPSTRSRPLVRDRSVVLLFGAYLATAAAMFFLFNPSDTPSLGVLLTFGVLVATLVGLARLVPAQVDLRPRAGGLRSPVVVGVIGGLFVWLTFGTYWLLPVFSVPPALVVAVAASIATLSGLLTVREVQSGVPDHRLALATGLLSFLFVFSFAVSLAGDALAFVVTLGVVYMLWWIRRRLHAPQPRPPPGALVGPA